MQTLPPFRIAMWSGPRNISTAMMRAFENRPDTAVIDEPFYAAYLAASGAEHPLREAALAAQPIDPRAVIATLLGPVPGGAPVFYQKHMTHHMLPGFDLGWMASCQNAFLIRTPERVLASYARKRADVTLADIGFARQAEIFAREAERLGTAPPVIDADDVLADPHAALNALCGAVGLPFSDSMLNWPAGRRATDGVWAPHWYQSVEQSTGFSGPQPPPAPLPAHLQALAEQAHASYARLAAHKIAVG